MRLVELRLTPFGHFDDLVLAFRPGAVHVVYGPNEAGKSTCHAALVGHFFGWAKTKKDAPGVAQVRGSLSRVGARWKSREGAETVEATRLAGQKVVDERGTELAEGSYEARFAPFGRADFETFFALDHGTLRDGGSLLGDKSGGLRDALFAAARSGEDIGRVRQALIAEEEALFKPRARVLLVNKAVATMKEASERARALSSPPEKWDLEAQGVERAAAASAALSVEYATLGNDVKRLEDIRKLLECTGKLRETEDAMAALPPAVDVGADPAGVRARLLQLDALRAAAASQATTSAAQAEILGAQLDSARTQAQFAAHIEAAREARSAALDLARLARAAEGGPAPELREPPSEERLQPLEEALQRLLHVRAECIRIVDGVGEYTIELERLGAVPAAPLPTATELRSLERRAHEAEATAARTVQQRTQHVRAVSELEVRTGIDAAQGVLVALPLPTREEARELVARLKEHDVAATRAEQELARTCEQLAALAHELESLVKQTRIPREEDLVRARLARDLLVTGKPVALVLAAAIREADAIVDVMRSAADRVAERAAKEDEVARTSARSTQLAGEATSLRARAEAGAQALSARMGGLPGPKRSAFELESWASWRERAQQLVVDERELERAEAMQLALASGLTAAAAEYADLAERAEAAERQRSLASMRHTELGAAVARSQSELANAQVHQRAAEQAVQEQARTLAANADDAATLAEWIRAARTERAAWERAAARAGEHVRAAQTIAECKQLLRERLPLLGFTLGADAPPETIATALDERVHGAIKAEERAAALAKELTAALAAHAVAVAERDAAATELDALLAGLGQPDVATAAHLLQIEASRAVLRAAHVAERALAARIAAPADPAPLLAEAAGFESHALDRALAEKRLRRAEVDTALEQARRDEAGKRAGLAQMSQADHTASLALFEAESARADAVALGTRWAVARLGVTLLHRALERYRQEHQDPVLAHASLAFAALTGGRYVRIVPELGDGKERLRLAALRNDGTLHVASVLSEGTRDQLYLAMRFGTLEARAEDGSLPLPIVLDDVFVNFDEERTAAGLAQLASLVLFTDVVYFTHHERVVELAQRALPPHLLDVVRLPGRPNDAADLRPR